MIKAEKYKEEIKDAGYDFALIKNKIVACNKWNKCADCEFSACEGCDIPRIAWLLEDYNPILTDEEKRILQNIIDALRPLGKKVKTISKRDFSPSLDEYLHFTYDDDSATTTTFDGNKMFVGMKIQKEYTLEELGLR